MKIVVVKYPDSITIDLTKGSIVSISGQGAQLDNVIVMTVADVYEEPAVPHTHSVLGNTGEPII